MEELIPPIRERLPERIASQLKSLILFKKINVHEKLPPERAFAKMFKVSRVVIRQAFTLLEQSGFVEIRPGPKGGAFITHNLYKPLMAHMSDLFKEGSLTLHHFSEVRKAIECYVIREVAAKASESDINRIEVILRNMGNCLEDPRKLREFNSDFHITLADISGNPLAKSILQSTFGLLGTLWDTFYPEKLQDVRFLKETHRRHERIVEALKASDIELCEKLVAIDADALKDLKY